VDGASAGAPDTRRQRFVALNRPVRCSRNIRDSRYGVRRRRAVRPPHRRDLRRVHRCPLPVASRPAARWRRHVQRRSRGRRRIEGSAAEARGDVRLQARFSAARRWSLIAW